MTLEVLSEQYHCRITRDGCGDRIIPGKYGHLCTDEGRLMVALTDDGRKAFTSANRKNSLIRQLGDRLRITQHGDFELIGHIAEDPATIRLCLRSLGIPRRRILTPERKEALAASSRAFRFRPGAVLEPIPASHNASPGPSHIRNTPVAKQQAFPPSVPLGAGSEHGP